MLFENLTRMWNTCNPPPETVDLIAVVSYGATGNRLTKGAEAIVKKAFALYKNHPEALAAYGAFTLSPDPKVEERIKRQIFPNGIFAGTVISTIEECQKIKAALPTGFGPKKVVVVTGTCHSRTARLVWKTYFPNSQIFLVTIPAYEEIDPENPMKFLRSSWKWFGINVIRHFVFKIVGVTRMEKFKLYQPTAT